MLRNYLITAFRNLRRHKVYTLINDVAAYPEFMEGCVGAELISHHDNVMEARLDLAKAGFRHSFTTRNTLYPPHRIVMTLVNGPFSVFEGNWTLESLHHQACKVSLQLRFTLINPWVDLAAGQLFNPLANHLVAAVAQRAKHVYA